MISEKLFPMSLPSLEEIAKRYPPRNLPPDAAVTRFSPSPTGFVHFGALFPSFVGERLARQSGGIFYLRIEDTDAKREVEGGVEGIVRGLRFYEVEFDEGVDDKGDYGPYRQRLRVELYGAYAKHLYEQGLAYPCFCTEEDLTAMRNTQESRKDNYGYYGDYARCRDLSDDAVGEKLAAGLPYVLRLRAPAASDERVILKDEIRGKLDFPENTVDHVLLKSDGIPTYHFAHAVDDHLMGTTHVIRGDEWLATYPLHHQLFTMLGFPRPRYAHISPLMKMDGDSKRKLSKRKDPEVALDFYWERGYTVPAVREYIMTLLNSNFEDWRRQNPNAPLGDFPFSLKKMNVAGALFDPRKLDDVSRNVIARMSAKEVYDRALVWLSQYRPVLAELFARDEDTALRILSIGRGGGKPRKDFAVWNDIEPYLSFFYDELFVPPAAPPQGFTAEEFVRVTAAYHHEPSESASDWFDRVKVLAQSLGYCPDMKVFKQDPAPWRGSVADVSMMLRLAVTGRENAPDLREVMDILGAERVTARLQNVGKALC